MDLLLAAIGITVISSFILYSFYKEPLNLRWVKFYYGKYSYNYIKFHIELTTYRPYNHGISDDPQNHYRAFFKNNYDCLSFHVNEELEFSKERFFTNEKAFLKKRCAPSTFNAEIFNDKINLHIYGFNSIFFGKEKNVHYYFLEKKMFTGEINFVDSDKYYIDTVSRELQKKYLGEVKASQSREFMIYGANQSKIHFLYNGFDLSIRYFSGKNESINKILSNSLDYEREKNYLEDEALLPDIL